MLVTVGSGFDAREGLLLLNERTRQVLLKQRITVMKILSEMLDNREEYWCAEGHAFPLRWWLNVFLVFHVHDKLNKL